MTHMSQSARAPHWLLSLMHSRLSASRPTGARTAPVVRGVCLTRSGLAAPMDPALELGVPHPVPSPKIEPLRFSLVLGLHDPPDGPLSRNILHECGWEYCGVMHGPRHTAMNRNSTIGRLVRYGPSVQSSSAEMSRMTSPPGLRPGNRFLLPDVTDSWILQDYFGPYPFALQSHQTLERIILIIRSTKVVTRSFSQAIAQHSSSWQCTS
jgi:hypothetical protein